MSRFKTLDEKISEKIASLLSEDEEELSPLQKKYREFFFRKMDEYNIKSPADLKTDEEKIKFFDDIKDSWEKEKKEKNLE